MREFSVVFYNRDFTGRLPVRDVKVSRYSWNMIGGPEQAFLTAAPTADRWELTKLLRCPVEIYDGDGRLNWWGYVNRVTIPYKEQRVGLGLDELFNYITVNYDGGVTAVGSDTESISEYGQKEYTFTSNNASQTEGEQSRDLYLAEHKYPRPEIEFTGGSEEISIECNGWYSTLGWKYYSAAASTSNTENANQITSVIANSEFLAGSIIEDASGLTSDQFRDGTRTGLTVVNELLGAGTSNTRPLLAKVDKDRYLHIYERTQEPPIGAADYILREDGRIETKLGAIENDSYCRVAAWVQVGNVPNMLGGLSAMRPFFIESAEYDAENDKTTYRPAGAFEQIRLAKYISSIVSGNSYGTSGSGGTPIWWTPEPAPLSYDIKSVYGTDFGTDIATGASKYFHPGGSLSSQINTGSTGLVASGVGGGKTGWVHTGKGKFIIYAYCELMQGTAAPTSGTVGMWIMRTRVASSSNTFISGGTAIYPQGTGALDSKNAHINAVAGVQISLTLDEGFTFRFFNDTNGDVQINQLLVVFIKL